jgi:asparagine synthase (glutamine-hydrolysing)
MDVRERQAKELHRNGIVDRIENSYCIGKSYGIEYRYPLLDVKLIEYYYNLPTILKYKNGIGRYLLRKAIEDLVPDELCWRTQSISNTIPNHQYRIEKDMKIFRALILECREILGYHYFDYDKLFEMAELVEKRGRGKRICFGPRLFIYAIQILILQKWQREGKIDIGIKC